MFHTPRAGDVILTSTGIEVIMNNGCVLDLGALSIRISRGVRRAGMALRVIDGR